MAEKESPTHTPMDPKKKKILLGVGAFGVIVVGYMWYKSKSSSSSSGVSGSGITSYVAPSGASSLTSGSGTTSNPNPITNTFTPVVNLIGGGSAGGGSGKVVGPAGGNATHTPISHPAKKGGKHALHLPAPNKGSVHVSPGTTRISGTTSTARPIKVVTNAISGTTSTARPIKVVTNANGYKDTAAVNALKGANAARARALKSHNPTAIHNATMNVKKAQSIVASRNRSAGRKTIKPTTTRQSRVNALHYK